MSHKVVPYVYIDCWQGGNQEWDAEVLAKEMLILECYPSIIRPGLVMTDNTPEVKRWLMRNGLTYSTQEPDES